MKIILQALVLFSFVISLPSWSMDRTSTDIESSDSENEEIYLQVDQPGTYIAYFSVRAINRGPENTNLIIRLDINNKTKNLKQYKIKGNSIQMIEDFIQFTSNRNDLLQMKFNAPDFVDLETLGVEYIPFEPKNKL